MKRFRLTIRQPNVAPYVLHAIARSSADALISLIERLPAGAMVTVRPA